MTFSQFVRGHFQGYGNTSHILIFGEINTSQIVRVSELCRCQVLSPEKGGGILTGSIKASYLNIAAQKNGLSQFRRRNS